MEVAINTYAWRSDQSLCIDAIKKAIDAAIGDIHTGCLVIGIRISGPMAGTTAAADSILNTNPPWDKFKHATCRGSYFLGSACGLCERCAWEKQFYTPAATRSQPAQTTRALPTQDAPPDDLG